MINLEDGKCTMPDGNWTTYTRDAIIPNEESRPVKASYRPNNAEELANLCKGCNNFGPDYSASYKCGTKWTKSAKGQAGESSRIEWGDAAEFDCTKENSRCRSGVLEVKSNGEVTFSNNNGQLQNRWYFEPGVADEYYASRKGNEKYGGVGEDGKLTADKPMRLDEFLGSVDGNLYVKLQLKEGKVQLVAARQETACKPDVPGDNSTITSRADGVVAPHKMKFGPISTEQRGEIAYVDTGDDLRWYGKGTSTIENSSEYYGAGGYDMSGKVPLQEEDIGEEECKQACNDLSDCYGYVFGGSNGKKCKLYNEENMFPTALDRIPMADAHMYVRLKGIDNSKTCSNEVVGISSEDIRRLTDGQPMTETSLCRVAEATEEQTKTLNATEPGLAGSMKALRKTTVRLATDNQTLESDAKVQVKKQKEYGEDFTRIGQEQDAIMRKHGTILGMDENAALEMLSSNYQMILWTTAGLAAAIACIRFSRQLS